MRIVNNSPAAGFDVERVQAWPQCTQLVSQQQSCTQSILDIPNAQSTPTQHQSASPGTARFFVSSPAVAMPELRNSAEVSDVPDGVAGDEVLLGDGELERVCDSTGEAEDSGRLESAKREAQGMLQLVAKARRRHAGQVRP